MPGLKDLLKTLPCRPSELSSELHGVLKDVAKSMPESAANSGLCTESHFLLRAQQHLRELNERYFPLSGKSQQEVVAATAARVGLSMPKTNLPPSDGDKQ
mgnify:CR=1 FL=1